jgi:hypothetical protein
MKAGTVLGLFCIKKLKKEDVRSTEVWRLWLALYILNKCLLTSEYKMLLLKDIKSAVRSMPEDNYAVGHYLLKMSHKNPTECS